MNRGEAGRRHQLQFVEETRDIGEAGGASDFQMRDPFVDSANARIEDSAAERNSCGAQFGGKFLAGPPFPSILDTERGQRLLEHREIDLGAKTEVGLRRER